MLETTDEMVFRENEIVRGHYIYSMAESLAMSVIDASVALVGVANIKYVITSYSIHYTKLYEAVHPAADGAGGVRRVRRSV